MNLRPRAKITSLVYFTCLLLQTTQAISASKPTYISLGTGFGSSKKEVLFTTYGAKSDATKSVDRINFETADYMSYRQKTITLTPNSGMDFGVIIGAVDAKTGVGIEGEFGYFSTSSEQFIDDAGNNFVPSDLDGGDGSTDNITMPAPVADAGVKFSNFKRSGGFQSMRTTLNFLFFPIMSQNSSDFYIGAGAGFGQSGAYYSRAADVQYKVAAGTYGTATRKTLGPEISPEGWSALFQGFIGLRIPYESDSAFDLRINYIYGNTKEQKTGLYGYVTDATTGSTYNTNSQQGMTEANYTTPTTVVTTNGSENPYTDTVKHPFDHLSITLSASFSPY